MIKTLAHMLRVQAYHDIEKLSCSFGLSVGLSQVKTSRYLRYLFPLFVKSANEAFLSRSCSSLSRKKSRKNLNGESIWS